MTTMETTMNAATAEDNLRTVLRINGALSTTTGIAGLVLGGPLADLLGVEQVWLVRLLGAGLAAFAAFVLYVSTRPTAMLRTLAAEISMADIGWVVGTVVVIALGWLSTAGAVVMSVIGVAVLTMGVAQWQLRSQISS